MSRLIYRAVALLLVMSATATSVLVAAPSIRAAPTNLPEPLTGNLVSYYLQNVTLSDGGSLSGYLTLGPPLPPLYKGANFFQPIWQAYIVSTPGPGTPGFVYTQGSRPCGSQGCDVAPGSGANFLLQPKDPVTFNDLLLPPISIVIPKFDPSAAVNTIAAGGDSAGRRYRGGTLVRSSPAPALLTLANASAIVYTKSVVGLGLGDYIFLDETPPFDNLGLRAVAWGLASQTPDPKQVAFTQVIIAIRGTDVDDGSAVELKNLAADLGFGSSQATKTLHTEVQQAVQFVLTVRKEAPQASITLTGHSLGGAVAQLIGQLSGLPTVVFNAPGTQLVYGDLFNDLLPINRHGTTNPTGAWNVNYRVLGDQVSLAGPQLQNTSIITLSAPPYLDVTRVFGPVDTSCIACLYSGFMTAFESIGRLHYINTVIAQLANPSTTETVGAVGPNGAKALFDAIQPAGSLNGVYQFEFRVNDDQAVLLDPDSGNDFVLAEVLGSPEITCTDLPVLAEVDAYSVRTLTTAGAWSTFSTVSPGVQTCFDRSISGLEFIPMDKGGLPINFPGSFPMELLFAQPGDFVGSLTVTQRSDGDTAPAATTATPGDAGSGTSASPPDGDNTGDASSP